VVAVGGDAGGVGEGGGVFDAAGVVADERQVDVGSEVDHVLASTVCAQFIREEGGSPIPALAHVDRALVRLTVSYKRSRSARSAASPCTAVTFRPISLTVSVQRVLPPSLEGVWLRRAWKGHHRSVVC
jgi:hypothetical protein